MTSLHGHNTVLQPTYALHVPGLKPILCGILAWITTKYYMDVQNQDITKLAR